MSKNEIKPTNEIYNWGDGKRDPEIDVLKGIAIILVVIGHTFPPFREYIYLFHMAVFLMASGYFWDSSKIINRRSLGKFWLKKWVCLKSCGIESFSRPR